MTDSAPAIRRALISVSDKSGLVDLAMFLAGRGVDKRAARKAELRQSNSRLHASAFARLPPIPRPRVHGLDHRYR